MRHRTTITSALVSAAVVLVLVGGAPGAAAATPSEVLQQHGFAVFEWHRLSQVNAVVTDQRLSDLREDGFTTIYADISEYVEVADQHEHDSGGDEGAGDRRSLPHQTSDQPSSPDPV